MHFIENGVRGEVLDFLLKGKAIVYGVYTKWCPQKSA